MSKRKNRSSGRSSKGFLIFLAIILALLFLTNPTMDDFSNYTQKELTKTATSDLEKGLAAAIADPLIKAATYRDNYYIFSIYRYKFESSNDNVIGILKTFIPIK